MFMLTFKTSSLMLFYKTLQALLHVNMYPHCKTTEKCKLERDVHEARIHTHLFYSPPYSQSLGEKFSNDSLNKYLLTRLINE